jgi:hypothetical protein
LRIEVVNGKKIYYCNFRVYLVTGPIEGRCQVAEAPCQKKNQKCDFNVRHCMGS